MTYRDFIRAMNCTLNEYGNKAYLQRTYTRGDGRRVHLEYDLVTGTLRAACKADQSGSQLIWDQHGDLVHVTLWSAQHGRAYYTRSQGDVPWEHVIEDRKGRGPHKLAPDFDPEPYIREVLGDLL